jgi:hypothetical protein
MPTRTTRTFEAKASLAFTKPEDLIIVNGTMKDGFAASQFSVLGQITASKLLRRRSRTLATGAGFVDSSNTGYVVDASVFAVDDVLKNEGGETIGTIQVVNTDANTVALVDNALVNVAADEAVLASDGSQKAAGIADDAVDGDGDTPIGVIVDGPPLNAALIEGLDDSAVAEMGGALMVGGLLKL